MSSNLPATQTDSALLALTQRTESLQGMLQSLCAQNALLIDQVAKLQEIVTRLDHISTAQQRMISDALRKRAQEIAAQYSLGGNAAQKKLAAIIRGEIKRAAAVRSMAELPRNGLDAYLRYISAWDDYKTVRAMREAEK